jgi:hypothetical protein
MPTGNKTGSLNTQANCAGLSGNNNLPLAGSSAPTFGITAPAGLIGTIGTNGSSSCTLPLADPSQTATTSSIVAVFWLAAGVLQACYDLAVASVSFSTPTNTLTVTQSGSVPTTGKFWAASGSAPTALPANGTPITAAINQDVTLGVSINSGTGANIQQLIATSTQPGLIEWCNNASNSPTSQRLSAILTSGAFDTWPIQASQSGGLPSGAGNWAANATVANIRCYNLGSTPASVGTSSQSANMQAALLLT